MPTKTREPEVTAIGENLEAMIDGNILTLYIDLSQKGRPSSTGKMTLIASTGGWKTLNGSEYSLNLTMGYKNA